MCIFAVSHDFFRDMGIDLLCQKSYPFLYAGGASHVVATISPASKLQAVSQSLPTFQKLIKALLGSMKKPEQSLVASLAPLHQKAAVGTEAYGSHPAPADAALHLGAITNRPQGPTFVPIGLKALCIQGRAETLTCQSSGWAVTGKAL